MTDIPIPHSDALAEGETHTLEEFNRRAGELLSLNPESMTEADFDKLILVMRKQAENWEEAERNGTTRVAAKRNSLATAATTSPGGL